MANLPGIIGVFWSYTYMEGIWVFKPWPNSYFWYCVVASFWMLLLGMEIRHVGWNPMFVFWWQEYGMYERSRPLVHPLWVCDGWLGGISVYHNDYTIIQPKEKVRLAMWLLPNTNLIKLAEQKSIFWVFELQFKSHKNKRLQGQVFLIARASIFCR